MQQFLTVFTIGLSLARFKRAFGISVGVNTSTPTLAKPLDYNTQKAESRNYNNFADKNNDFAETFKHL